MYPSISSVSLHLLNGSTYGNGLTPDTLVVVPAAMVNPSSALLLPEQSYELMVMNHRDNFLNDALVSNFAVRNQSGEIELQLINKTEESFLGSLFEAWVCRELIANPLAGLAAFRWATRRPGAWPTTYSRFVPFVTANPALKGDVYTAPFYSTSDNSDIRFYAVKPTAMNSIHAPGLALIDGTTIPAGIQVKAIRKNLTEEIIKPLIENRYESVLTLLPAEQGWSSAVSCQTTLRLMIANRQIDPGLGLQLMGRIKGPEDIGLSRSRVNDYANFARQVYARHKRDDFDRIWLNLASMPTEVITPVVAASAAAMEPNNGPIILPESSAIERQQQVVHNGWGGVALQEQPFSVSKQDR